MDNNMVDTTATSQQPETETGSAPPVSPPLPISETPPITPATPFGQTMVTSSLEKQKVSRFTIFVIGGVVLLAVIWGVVGYLYFQNKNLEKEEVPQETVATEITPEPEEQVLASEIQISNGSIARITSFGEVKTLVSKEDYPGSGIIGFSRVVVSADTRKFCFESIPPALDPALYVANIDGTEVFEVAKNRRSCTWGLDSNTILYTNDPLGTNTVDIYTYDLSTKTERNITIDTQTPIEQRHYSITNIVGNKLECKYEVVGSTGKKLSESNCEIDLPSGSVSSVTETQS